jgi:hypothetical protein
MKSELPFKVPSELSAVGTAGNLSNHHATLKSVSPPKRLIMDFVVD